MSQKWFECSVRYRKTVEGVQKVVTEVYLVDALSFTEAESRVTAAVTEFIVEEFKITNIKNSNYAEVHNFEDAETWFKSKVSLIAYDEESGKERKTNIYLLVRADDAKETFDNTVLVMKDTMGEYTIPTISETKIIEVFQYSSGNVE
jgi:hypothetical protein